MIRRIGGAFTLLVGLSLMGWIFYNLFIHRMPETEGRPIVGPIGVTVLLIYVGSRWIMGKTAK